MWSIVAKEVSKHPHSSLASLRAQISEVMADMDIGQGGCHPPLQEVLVSDCGCCGGQWEFYQINV